MSWTSFRNRGETLRAVVETAERRRDGLLPMDVDGVAEAFRDESDLLAALQLRWHTRLAGRVERELAAQPLDLQAAVIAAWRATADDNAGILAIIDHCTAHPVDDTMARVLNISAAKGHAMLAVNAGLSSLPANAASVRIGRELEQRARLGHVPATRVPQATPSLLDRLRAALAA